MILGLFFGDLWNFLGCHPSQGFRWNKLVWFFHRFWYFGCWCVHHVNQHRVGCHDFSKKTRGCSFPPCVGGFAGGWPSPTEGLAAWARTATSAALSRTAGASHAGSCTQHAGRSSSEVHGDQGKKMKVWLKYRKKHQWFSVIGVGFWCHIGSLKLDKVFEKKSRIRSMPGRAGSCLFVTALLVPRRKLTWLAGKCTMDHLSQCISYWKWGFSSQSC